MPDYSKGKIYTIRFHNDNEIYVGSTIQPLSVRFGGHKRKNNSAVYKYIYDKYDGDFENCYIELYENFSCETKEELCKKEGEIIRLIGTLNKEIAGRTDKEWHEENKEILIGKQKEYYIKNKELFSEKSKKYYKDKKQLIVERTKQYYENNKQIILEKYKEKVICECGCERTKCNLDRHRQSKKHIELMSKLSQPIIS
jgi:hypothetical protein